MRGVTLLNKITCCFILAVSLLLVGCGEDSSNHESASNPNNAANVSTKNNGSTEVETNLSKTVIKAYENEHGKFEVNYTKDNLGLIETFNDFGLHVSSIEYGVFSVSGAYDYYPDLENGEGKIGYVKIKIAMDIPETLDPSFFFYPNYTVLTISQEIPPISTDNNFSDNVGVNLGELNMEEGYLFYLLAPNEKDRLDEVKSITLSTFAPFTSKNMDLKEGYTFNIILE